MKMNKKPGIALVCFLMITAAFSQPAIAQQKFEKTAFYEVMASENLDAVNNEIAILADAAINNKGGYEGALLMRKAGLVSPAAKRLRFFKEGRIKLETALMADNDNTEYHFLRLAVEEHAPKIVKYHADIEKDKLFVQKNFKNLSPAVQRAILDYCKKSKVLHAEDL